MSDDPKSLSIGEMIVSASPIIVSTILGSCVSVCIFSSTGSGGMIHFALPDKTHAKNSNRSDFNFGDLAIEALVKRILALPGVELNQLRAKVAGGANVVEELTHATSIGELNISMARQKLKELGIPIISESVGGNEARKLYFYTESGRLRISKTTNSSQIKLNADKKRVLIIDDSKTIRQIFHKIINSQHLEVVGSACSAEEALPLISSLRPDLITLDINMPGMSGVELLKKYLPVFPIPTVMISSINLNESHLALEALEIGAVDYIQKPSLEEISQHADFIREKLLIAANIKVVVRPKIIRNVSIKLRNLKNTSNDKVVAIGASTGGTEAIKEVLSRLPANIPPILIVQHIPAVFSTAFSKRLNELCPFEVIEGADGDLVLPGRVIIAPGGLQMEVIKSNGELRVRVFAGERVNRHIPSVDVLFNSVAHLLGDKGIGVILTGMGNDGAAGLLKMRKAGAITIGQNEESSVVYGMPKAAAQLGGVMHTCSLVDVADSVFKILEKGKVA